MNLVDTLSKGLSDYNSEAYQWSLGVIANATLKTALYIVGVLFIIELIGLFEKANTTNDGLMTFKMFQGTGVRFVFAIAMVGMPAVIFNFILLIANGLVHLIGGSSGDTYSVLTNLIPTITPPDSMSSALGTAWNAITNPSSIVGALVLYILGMLIQFVAYIGVWVLIYLRMFEMFGMLILGPIPMASFASAEHRNIGVNYIKRFAAYAFQSVVILIVMGLYTIFAKTAINLTLPSSGFFATVKSDASFFAGIVYMIVFVITLFGTIRKSKELFGVGF